LRHVGSEKWIITAHHPQAILRADTEAGEGAMRKLELGPESLAYMLRDDSPLEVLIVPSGHLSSLFVKPELSGISFQAELGALVSEAIKAVSAPGSATKASSHLHPPFDVLQILRGALSFSVDRALFQATGVSPSVSFVSSQRTFDEHGRPAVEGTNYQKWSIQHDAVLVIADIAATGTTISKALDEALAQYEEESKRLTYLLIIAVGTWYLEAVVRRYAEELYRRWSHVFKGATLVYLERVFTLNERANPVLEGHKCGVDFFRKRSPSCPESDAAANTRPLAMLERCAIYDGGVRAFQPVLHLDELRKYWKDLRGRADGNLLEDLIHAKTDLYDYTQPYQTWLSQRPWWRSLDAGTLRDSYERGQRCLDTLLSWDLRDACQDRLQTLCANEFLEC
jgi:hypothetical protein